MAIKLSMMDQFHRNNNNVKKEIQDGFKRASSLISCDSFRELSSINAAEKITTIDTAISGHEMFYNLISDANQNIQFLDKQLNELLEISTEHHNNMIFLMGSSRESIHYPILAKNFLSGVKLILNAKFDNKYIFSGEDYNSESVSDIETKSNIILGMPSSNYYNGGSVVSSVSINDSKEILEYGVNADNQAFQDLIGGVHLSLSAFNDDKITNKDILVDAQDLVSGALKKIIKLRAKLGNDWKSIDQKLSNYKNQKDYWQEEKDKIYDVDIVDAKMKLDMPLRNLESSYTALDKIKSVNLLNYLK